MSYTFIDSSDELAKYCKQASQHKAIAVDTEFVRTRTFYPQIGLVQIYDGESVALIDPIAIDDLSDLTALMLNENVVKVFHACSEDLETFNHALDIIPTPIYDTQIAAGFAKIGPTMGYGRMVEALLEKTLEKGESRTDWLKRPLSSEQLQYAAEDVLFLLPCYELLVNKLPAHKNEWVAQEITQLSLRKAAELAPEDAYLLFKNIHKLNPLNLAVLQRLAAWRLRYARRHDITQNFIARETSLYEVALKLPTSKSAVFHLDVVAPQEARKHGEVFAQIVKECRALDPSEYPPHARRLMDVPSYKKMYANIKAICQTVADEVDCELAELASKRQINQILTWYWWDYDDTRAWGMQPDLLTGWRAPLLAQKIQDLMLETTRA